jgi:uncharacterized protein (DUF488 family)
VISIGYEGRTMGEFLALLRAHSVRKVLDVRELPLSRRRGFSKTPLGSALEAVGIAYQHLRAAGNPHRRLKADTALCLTLYSQHLADHPEVLNLVSEELRDGPVAMLCFERLHDACHRSCLLEAIRRSDGGGIEVIRIE